MNDEELNARCLSVLGVPAYQGHDRFYGLVDYAVNNPVDGEHVSKSFGEALWWALGIATEHGTANLDVLIWSEKGAREFGGDDAVEWYREDPDASVFERYTFEVERLGAAQPDSAKALFDAASEAITREEALIDGLPIRTNFVGRVR